MAEAAPDTPEIARSLARTIRREDFEAPPEEDLEALRPFADGREYPAGSILFRQGESPEAIFIIEEGEVELVYATRFERLIVQILAAGSSLGDLPVLLGMPSPYTAVARTPTTTLFFDLDVVRRLIEDHPDVCFRWMRLVARRLDRAYRRLVEMAGKSASVRIIHFLLDESEERRALSIEVTQGDVAATLALSRQTVSRVLGQLERQG